MDFVKSTPGDTPIVVECFLNTTPEVVFKAWTDPEIVKRWFGMEPNSLHSASIDLRVGGEYRFTRKTTDNKTMTFEGRYLEIVDGEFLKFTWSITSDSSNSQLDGSEQSEVEVSFSKDGQGTKLRVQHSALETTKNSQDFAVGWNASLKNIVNMIS